MDYLYMLLFAWGSPWLFFLIFAISPIVLGFFLCLGLSFDNSVFAALVFYGVVSRLFKLISAPRQNGNGSRNTNSKDQ